jgi:hypothetical protein
VQGNIWGTLDRPFTSLWAAKAERPSDSPCADAPGLQWCSVHRRADVRVTKQFQLHLNRPCRTHSKESNRRAERSASRVARYRLSSLAGTSQRRSAVHGCSGLPVRLLAKTHELSVSVVLSSMRDRPAPVAVSGPCVRTQGIIVMLCTQGPCQRRASEQFRSRRLKRHALSRRMPCRFYGPSVGDQRRGFDRAPPGRLALEDERNASRIGALGSSHEGDEDSPPVSVHLVGRNHEARPCFAHF